MPRITGPSIQAHVAQQEAAVVAAATRLFAERGFSEVTMTDIARAVGLARTSLYRYFPDKDHILLAWLRQETVGLLERSSEIAAADQPATVRLRRWLALQLDYVADADHRLFRDIASTMDNLGPVVRDEIGTEHRRLYATVERIVADALADAPAGQAAGGRDPALIAGLVVGLFRAAGDQVAAGSDRRSVQAELERGAIALVRPDGPASGPDDEV